MNFPPRGPLSPFLAVVRFLARGAAAALLEVRTRRAAPGAARDVAEPLPEPRRHQVVEDGVDGGAQVEAGAGDDVDALEDRLVPSGRRVDVAPHQAVHVEGSPAEAEDDHQHAWKTPSGRIRTKFANERFSFVLPRKTVALPSQ